MLYNIIAIPSNILLCESFDCISSLILVDWFMYFGSLDKQKSYSPGVLAHDALGLQASI